MFLTKLKAYIKYNWKVYLLFCTQFIVIFTIWIITQNSIYSGRETLSKIKSEFPDNSFRILLTDIKSGMLEITHEDYNTIKRNAPNDINLSFSSVYSVQNYNQNSGQFEYSSLVYLDETKANDLLGYIPNEKCIIHPKYKDKILSFWTNIQGSKVFETSIEYNGMSFPYELKSFDDIYIRKDFELDKDDTLSRNISLEQSLIVPQSLLKKFEELKLPELATLKLQFTNMDAVLENSDITLLENFIKTLNANSNSNLSYSTDHMLSKNEKGISDSTELLKQLNMYSIGLLLITIPGMIGIYSVFIKRRTTDHAISMMVGAKVSTIIKEIVLEVLLLIVFCFIISIILAFTLNDLGSTYVYMNGFHLKSLILALIWALLIAIVVLIRPIYLLNKNLLSLFREGERL